MSPSLKTLALVLPFALWGAGAAAHGPDDVAKTQFGAAVRPSSHVSQPIGGYSRGCQAGGTQLAETGPTWQAMRCHSKRALTWERGDFGLRCAIHD